ncbi:enamine deaminase RidA (YjgF/YER057c/UK114 family) [Rhodothalassium salexigens DSM 2132]|uniref:Enamine deaminase RidA (YjgF/YER057c/UK114 family) n=1 Tax=Rhodothalassium salexigens DSM 2132 TaxID=1188247 RepID=A0A4R2PFA5_RHOSA|nr:RidA family protein [Rhodothalassium salexigens]MBB4211722.1 enamine deaminase RidA (YjgF/YER057c/UK114 family) [Rhodothalassium salexigens DSM 2132]MBK1639183.1 enamine deaminase RidA [Rhodothalassium salexigens DSM 2132]TCP33980.1 enamine deaminase RidA (YjgF/YER057c/UK114 family) [Rhodothalassium salexigens DSM 2132]
MTPLQPKGWPRPAGYSNGTAATGRLVFVAGQVGWDVDGGFPDSFAGQFEQTLKNTVAVLAAGGARPEHVTRMTWYVTDLAEYRTAMPVLGDIYRLHMGKVFPAMAVVGVTGLVELDAKLEIETTAVVPDA